MIGQASAKNFYMAGIGGDYVETRHALSLQVCYHVCGRNEKFLQ